MVLVNNFYFLRKPLLIMPHFYPIIWVKNRHVQFLPYPVELLYFILLYGPFLWMGFNCLKATATSRRQFTFYHSVPRNSWYSFYRPRKDEMLSQPWSHPVVFEHGTHLDWESSTLTTWPLVHITSGVKIGQHKISNIII